MNGNNRTQLKWTELRRCLVSHTFQTLMYGRIRHCAPALSFHMLKKKERKRGALNRI